MASVTGAADIQSAFKAASLKERKKVVGKVVYSAPYAIYVHENLEAHHPIGQAKFLEEPARLLEGEMREIIARSLRNKNGLEEGVRRANERLLEASQALVPVDTGFLRDSGHVEVTRE
jgi:hypothetical protein